MTLVDTMGPYVRRRLEAWGDEFALHRDCEYLGHAAKNILQVLIDHKGEMPGRTQGFKPLEVNQEAQQIEDVVAEIGRHNAAMAIVLRAYYCGRGRRKVERWETANLMLATAGHGVMRQLPFLRMAEIGTQMVGDSLAGRRVAA